MFKNLEREYLFMGRSMVDNEIARRGSVTKAVESLANEPVSKATNDMLIGIAVYATDLACQAAMAGIRFTNGAAWLNCDPNIGFLRLACELESGDPKRLVKAITVAAAAVDKCIVNGVISRPAQRNDTPESQKPQPVPVEPLPLKIEIVSMPARQTTVEVVRDADTGNIKSSSQVEQDV